MPEIRVISRHSRFSRLRLTSRAPYPPHGKPHTKPFPPALDKARWRGYVLGLAPVCQFTVSPATPPVLIPPMEVRDQQAALEQASLAPYARFSGNSRGRRYPEAPHALRTAYQRDRDRVIHSRAFRRLEYKTQVYVTGTDDHFRTRLTHTIEVAGITRTVARCLRLNEDLAEAIALAHDLGHPPFGHCGERALDELLQGHGGFDHNLQALRVVDLLEEKYPAMPGLNLTWELRAGLLKHRQTPLTLDGELLPPQAILEAQVADAADDLTYYGHDLDDGLSAGLLDPEKLQTLGLWQAAGERVRPQLAPDAPHFLPYMVRTLIDLLVGDLVRHSQANLAAAQLTRPEEAEHLAAPLIGFSPAYAAHCRELRRYLFENMYWHPVVLADNETAVTCMRQLYQYYLAHPEALGSNSRLRLQAEPLERVVADYLACMTDRYALEQYRRHLLGQAPGSERHSSFLPRAGA